MRPSYLYFLIYYLFDYYKGELPPLQTAKPILVFSSHSHRDHYNPEIFEILKNQTYQLPCQTTLETLLSTDAGVAFLLHCPEGTLYHAGDLNDWIWEGETEQYNKQMTGSYRHEINLLKDQEIDIAFLPLDPRQEAYYANGITYFLKKVHVKKVFPMHYWEKPEIIDKFIKEHPEYMAQIVY